MGWVRWRWRSITWNCQSQQSMRSVSSLTKPWVSCSSSQHTLWWSHLIHQSSWPIQQTWPSGARALPFWKLMSVQPEASFRFLQLSTTSTHQTAKYSRSTEPTIWSSSATGALYTFILRLKVRDSDGGTRMSTRRKAWVTTGSQQALLTRSSRATTLRSKQVLLNRSTSTLRTLQSESIPSHTKWSSADTSTNFSTQWIATRKTSPSGNTKQNPSTNRQSPLSQS